MKVYQVMFMSDEDYDDDGCPMDYPDSFIFTDRKVANKYRKRFENKSYVVELPIIENMEQLEQINER